MIVGTYLPIIFELIHYDEAELVAVGNTLERNALGWTDVDWERIGQTVGELIATHAGDNRGGVVRRKIYSLKQMYVAMQRELHRRRIVGQWVN